MKASWVTGLDAKQKDEISGEYTASAMLRRRLVSMLEKKQKSAYEKTLKEDAYDSPNWGFKQADSVGYQRAIAEIMELLQ